MTPEELAQRLDVSIDRVKKALLSLEEKGLVVTTIHKESSPKKQVIENQV